jgi:hypothetical protein
MGFQGQEIEEKERACYMKKTEEKELLLNNLVQRIQSHAITIESCIDIFTLSGNVNTRKKYRITVDMIKKAKNTLLEFPFQYVIAQYLLNSNKKMKKRYEKLLKEVDFQLAKNLKIQMEMKEKENENETTKKKSV